MKKIFTWIFMLSLMMVQASCTTAAGAVSPITDISEITDAAAAEETVPNAGPEDEPAGRVNKNDPDFYIVYTRDAVDFTGAPKADIGIYRWGADYTPKSYAQVVLKEGDGFYIRMECEETDPVAVFTEYNDPVYEDSCLEFFVNWMPGLSGRYINTEMNANGAYLCYLCDPDGKNVTMDTVTGSMPSVAAFMTDTSWGVTLYVPLGLIGDAYGSADFGPGSKVLANFYKCGDKTAVIHYGSWNEVISDSPNFHLPEYFAEIEIRE